MDDGFLSEMYEQLMYDVAVRKVWDESLTDL